MAGARCVSFTPIDFVSLEAALLDRADTLVPLWLPSGHKKGHYWYVGDFDGGEGKSANVNLKTGSWGDNGRPGDAGRNLVSLYGRIRGLSNVLAARELMADNGWQQYQPAVQTPAPAPQRKRKADDAQWMPIHPVPADAPPYRDHWGHYARGVPPLHWEYRNQAGELLGLVVRFDTSTGKKDVQPISFCQGSNGRREWRYKAFGAPRPLYGLWRLPADAPATPDKRPLAIVLEGEKKSDALYEALGRTTPVLSWPGGCKVPQLAGWQPLAGYRVVCWPDADAQRNKVTGDLLPRDDQPGMAAMLKVQALLAELGAPARIVDIGQPGEWPDGWDAANAIADDGWTHEQLLAFMRNLLPVVPGDAPPTSATPAPVGAAGTPTPPPAGAGGDERRDWRDDYIRAKGSVRECVPNVMLVLHEHAQWQGVLGFDRFAQRVVKRHPAPYDPVDLVSTEWTDVDDTRTAA